MPAITKMPRQAVIMYLSRSALGIIIAVLLSSTHSVIAVPSYGLQLLHTREESPPPDSKDDRLPKGDAQKLISWTDDDYAEEDYKHAPDYDPDQDKDFDTKKRSADVSLFTRANGPQKDTTGWLRSVGYDGM